MPRCALEAQTITPLQPLPIQCDGAIDQLVLDEVGLAVGLGYVEEAALLDALDQRPPAMDVVITGPSIPPSIVAMADQVTQLRRGF